MKYKNNYFIPITLAFLTILLISCSDHNNPVNTTPIPEITSIKPDSGLVGSSVTIKGQNFSSVKNGNTVLFNDTKSTVISASNSKLAVKVPMDINPGQVAVKVVINGAPSNEKTFTVIPSSVKIYDIQPDSGAIGSTVTITGVNFSANAQEDSVTFNGTPAKVTSATETQLKVTVPDGATSGTVKVSVNGK